MNDNDIGVFAGMTKVCIVPTYGEWVLKVDIQRETNDEYARRNKTTHYCEYELENFEKAKKEGIDDYFAEIYDLDEIEGVKFYLMQKVEPDENECSDYFSAYYDKYYDNDDGYYEDLSDEERIEALFENDDENMILKLKEFVTRNEINDLHGGNFGRRNDGRFVIIDYSGYWG